jgi:hypothetical protein
MAGGSPDHPPPGSHRAADGLRRAAIDIDPATYTAAEPDRSTSSNVTCWRDLADHDGPQIKSCVRCVLALTAGPTRIPRRPLRLDRYGLSSTPATPTAGYG